MTVDDIAGLVTSNPPAALALAIREYRNSSNADSRDRAVAAAAVASFASAAGQPWVSLRYSRYRLKHEQTYAAYNLAAAKAFQCGRVIEARDYLRRALDLASPRQLLASEATLRRELDHCERGIMKLRGPWGSRVRVFTRSDLGSIPQTDDAAIRVAAGLVNNAAPPFNESWWGIGNDLLKRRKTFADIVSVDGHASEGVRTASLRIAALLGGVIWLPFDALLIGPGPSIFFRNQRGPSNSVDDPHFPALIAAIVRFENGQLDEARKLIAQALTAAPSSTEAAHWYSVIMAYNPD